MPLALQTFALFLDICSQIKAMWPMWLHICLCTCFKKYIQDNMGKVNSIRSILFTLSKIFWDRMVHEGFCQICSATFYMITNILIKKSCIIVLLNLIRYFFALSRIFWGRILHHGSFKFVPLLFTPSRIFYDKNVHDDSFQSVPLLFILPGIF